MTGLDTPTNSPLKIMETGWSPWEGDHSYYSMATIGLISDIKHLLNT